MKKMNKKGFTIVELVIVIAVIAILAAVMIPTFSNVVKNAQKSAAVQEARNIHTQYLADIKYGEDTIIEDGHITVDSYVFNVESGELNVEPIGDDETTAGPEIKYPIVRADD